MTLVVDASAIAEILLNTQRGLRAAAKLGDHHLIAPDHLTAEVASVMRGWSLRGHLADAEPLQAFSAFHQLGIEQVAMSDFLPAVWALRHNLTAYDALYVVLARAAGCSLLSLDARLAAAASDCVVMP